MSKIFSCPQCGAPFATKGKMQSHLLEAPKGHRREESFSERMLRRINAKLLRANMEAGKTSPRQISKWAALQSRVERLSQIKLYLEYRIERDSSLDSKETKR